MSIRQSKFAKDLTQGPLLSQVLLFSLPIMLTSVLQLLFNTADRIVVGGGEARRRMSANPRWRRSAPAVR